MPLSINPATGATMAEYPAMPQAQIDAILRASARAAAAWADVPLAGRTAHALAAAAVLERQRDELALLITSEMGKPIRQARAEIEKCALVCRSYAADGPRYLADEPQPAAGGASAWLSYQPLGVVLGVMPWNFPFWQVFRFAAPTLTAGNGVILKHASNVTGCALAIEAVMRTAGYPADLFRTVIAGPDAVGRMIADPAIQGVTLTGSEQAGRVVAGAAGRAIKPTVLELGGSDPYLVLADADLDHAAETCARSRLLNSGQSCIAAKRFIVIESVRAAFTERFVERMAARLLGQPLDPATDIGPLARADLRDEVHAQVSRSLAAGARLLLGGAIPDQPGWYYPATVLDGVQPGMAVAEEEVFGPVAAIIGAADVDTAVRLANASRYGLGGAVFTGDPARGRAIARRLQCGTCCINDCVSSDPRLPFGGIKLSGYGRELSHHGLRAFVNIQTVVARSVR
jgi:succinate-semialdehyde dehydrogenase/glutarate-semialdehyde dehydrogenase